MNSSRLMKRAICFVDAKIVAKPFLEIVVMELKIKKDTWANVNEEILETLVNFC